MLRTTALTLSVASIATSITLATATSGAQASTGSSLGLSGTTKVMLKSTNFDPLTLGRITPTDFIETLGGSNRSTTTYDDSYGAKDTRNSGKVYRLKLARGTIHSNPSGNNGVNVFVPLSRQVDQACIAYDVRFDPNFDWSLGGKLPGLGGVAPGVSPATPTGGNYAKDKGWSGRMMWLTPKSYSWAGPTNMAISYMYHPGQSDQYGDNIRWNRSFKAGKWHRVRQCYVMNTPGKANGKLKAWLDGTQVVNRTNFVYRTRNDVHISHIYWSVFRGGATLKWAGLRDSYIDFDRVRVYTVR